MEDGNFNNKKFLEQNDFMSLDSNTYVNICIIKIKPLLYAPQHTSEINGLEDITLQGNPIDEIAFTDVITLDNPNNIGKYYINTDNSICFIVSREKILNNEMAKNYITGILVKYQMKVLQVNTVDNIFDMEVISSSGELINKTKGSNLPNLSSKISVLEMNQELNSDVGYYKYILTRNMN